MSCFVSPTGQTMPGNCKYCGSAVTLEEARDAEDDRRSWTPKPHRAPCGAHCAGGGVAQGENDVHVPLFGTCPRCGASDSRIARVIEHPDSKQRIVIHEWTAGAGYRIDHEVLDSGHWIVERRFPGPEGGPVETVIEHAAAWFPWLRKSAF
jgi:hypothetical protein